MRSSLACILVLTSTLVAQVTPGRAVVVTRLVPAGVTQMLEVDLASGASVPFGTFPSDALAPRALTLDPWDLDPVLALDLGNGTSRVVRLELNGLTVSSERTLGVLPGPVTDLRFAGDGVLLASVDGTQSGLWRMPRNGGPPVLIVPIPRARGLDGFGAGVGFGSVVSSGVTGPPLIDPAIHRLDFATGAGTATPLTGAQPPEVTALIDLPTAVPRVLLAHPNGTITLQELFLPPTTLALTPTLPPGATRAMVADAGLTPLVLGGAAHPFLKSFQFFQPTTWTIHAGPLPGDPVDFEVAPPATARQLPYGSACSPGPPMLTWFPWSPQLGTPGYAVNLVQGVPSSPTALVLGLDDDLALGVLPLPTSLPGGCTWYVDPLVVLPTSSDAAGAASIALPIPPAPGLAGTIVHLQWLQVLGGGSFATSQAWAVHLWP